MKYILVALLLASVVLGYSDSDISTGESEYDSNDSMSESDNEFDNDSEYKPTPQTVPQDEDSFCAFTEHLGDRIQVCFQRNVGKYFEHIKSGPGKGGPYSRIIQAETILTLCAKKVQLFYNQFYEGGSASKACPKPHKMSEDEVINHCETFNRGVIGEGAIYKPVPEGRFHNALKIIGGRCAKEWERQKAQAKSNYNN